MNCPNPKWVAPGGKPLLVPCGKCVACLHNKRQEWSFRLLQEWKRSVTAAFITLTYHPKFVPDSGVSKRHLQLFIKRLRKNEENVLQRKSSLRYYAVGEYGSHTARPHYHIILFGQETGDETIRKSWRIGDQEIGIVHIGKVTEASIRYTTKYVIQRSIVPCQVARPFALMSRSYGLGGFYLTEEMIKWHRDNKANYTNVYGEKGRLPRYYKDKIWYRSVNRKDGKVWQHFDRDEVSMVSSEEALRAELANVNYLIDLGYKNPREGIMKEMREAVMSRVKQKIAFTQSL